MKRLAALAALASTLVAATTAQAYCPSYTPAETAGGQNCGVEPAPGTNPTVAAWKLIFAKVAPGAASWGTDGPTIGTISSGCGKPKTKVAVPAHFPCHVLEAIAMHESNWTQFCVPAVPAASVGAPSRTIVSFDCGYGVGQVTSGMHVGETPTFDRARVAAEPTYNLATGTRILAGKWAATNCVGDNDPDVVEDWYTSIWAYNGLTYGNNPSNPNLTPGRGPYNPKNGGSYTYQERVLGWMEFPPADARWASLAPAYPNRGDVGTTGSPPALPEPSCASPTDCVNTRGTHVSSCGATPPPAAAGPPPVDAGPPPVDAGPTPADAADGGIGAQADAGGGCSCRSGAGDSSGAGVGSLSMLAMAWLVGRRRQRSPRESASTARKTSATRTSSS